MSKGPKPHWVCSSFTCLLTGREFVLVEDENEVTDTVFDMGTDTPMVRELALDLADELNKMEESNEQQTYYH